MGSQAKTFRLLIVDDNIELTEVLKEFLQQYCDSVECSYNGPDAISLFKKNSYDLVITDLNMPVINGIDLIKELKLMSECTEFVIITGYASIDTAIDAIKIGAYDYILKPFKMEQLAILVKNVKEKVTLKRANIELAAQLDSLLTELRRYGGDGPVRETIDATEHIVNSIAQIKRFDKNRFFID